MANKSVRETRELRGNGNAEEARRAEGAKRSVRGLIEELGSSFTLHGGLARPMTLSSLCVRVCVSASN